jgi:hypothetical protein
VSQPNKQLSHDSVKLAVELAKAALSQSGTFLNSPEVVAKFIEVVAERIESIWA